MAMTIIPPGNRLNISVSSWRLSHASSGRAHQRALVTIFASSLYQDLLDAVGCDCAADRSGREYFVVAFGIIRDRNDGRGRFAAAQAIRLNARPAHHAGYPGA